MKVQLNSSCCTRRNKAQKAILTLSEPAYNIFALRFQPKKQQFSVALPMP